MVQVTFQIECFYFEFQELYFILWGFVDERWVVDNEGSFDIVLEIFFILLLRIQVNERVQGIRFWVIKKNCKYLFIYVYKVLINYK